ncbi:MAG: glycosidase [Syntrophomonadaceae bacterium]|nr:glycosidase [Syntrophomonadaceae bacterium]
MTYPDIESRYDQKIDEIQPLLAQYSNYDLVIGIPFRDEIDHLPKMLASIDQVLKSWIGRRQLIVCAGDYSAGPILDTIHLLNLQHPHIEFLMPPEISGRGMSVRAIMDIASKLDADLILFNAHMTTDNGPGVDDAWLESLLTPIQGEYDIVLGSLRRYMGIDSIAHMMAAPILESFYGCRLGDPLGGIYALSHDFVEELAHEARFWGKYIQGHGIDFWILTRALCWSKRICEINKGGAVKTHSLETRNKIFYDNALTIFEALKRDSAIWLQDRLIIKVADILARSEIKRPDSVNYSIDDLLRNYYSGCEDNKDLCELVKSKIKLPLWEELEQGEKFYLSDEDWITALLELFLQYSFDENYNDQQIISLVTALYNGRVASYSLEMEAFAEKAAVVGEAELDNLMVGKMESIRQRLTNNFWDKKADFSRQWVEHREQRKPAIIPLGYMEYVPGKPVVVPKRIAGKDQHIVQTDDIFKDLRHRYESDFNQFLSQGLNLPVDTSPENIIRAVEEFMTRVEQTLDEILPGDIRIEEGLQQFIDKLFSIFPDQRMFTMSTDLLREMIIRFPPVNLMIPRGFYQPRQLIDNLDTRDAVTYANLVESLSYTDRDLIWLTENLKPESFEWTDLKPVLLTEEVRMGVLSQVKISNLNRVTGRIVIRPLDAAKGGKFPKLRYFTSIVRRMAQADHYSQLFINTVAERKNIGLKIRNSLLGVRRGDDFSAHNIFENFHHRNMMGKIQYLADKLEQEGKNEAARIIRLMASGYGLSQLLENEVFLTCTAWSWASYSYKGGVNIPTPLTTSVESRWFNHDFLEVLYRQLGYNPEEIMSIVFRLIQSGKSNQNLLDMLMPTRPKDVAVVVQETTNEPSRHLQRYHGNPLLEPIDSWWESKYVLNPGALRIGDKVYLFYRAVGEDQISRIGLAITDGYKVLERLSEPIFSPETPEEAMGCEDPRLTIVDGRIFMLYTAYDGNIAQIAAASIGLDDFKAGNYTNWQREGLAFKNIWDKDAIVFPEKIHGKYIVYHRIEPSIWVTYANELCFPLRENHAIIVGPRPGRMWDSLKIGAGAQALKTKYGWLLIYHGVDNNYVYRLGVLLVDLNNPQKVIYRSPNPILEPEEDYEIGLSGAWVPNVVFTCGAVAGSDKDILEDDDEILVYYGAADTSIGVATATLADLIPERFRISR